MKDALDNMTVGDAQDVLADFRDMLERGERGNN